MSVRNKRQKAFTMFIVALIVALIAGAAGFATGYGVNSDKRVSAVTENKMLREENKKLSEIEVDAEELNDLKAENEAYAVKVSELEQKIADLETKVAETETALSESEAALTEAENAMTEITDEFKEEKKKSEGSFVGTITKWFIIGIIGILVIMGAAMILLPKFSKKNDKDDDEDDDYYEETEEEEIFEAVEETGTAEDVTKEIPVVKEGYEEEEITEDDKEDVQTEISFEEQIVPSKEVVNEEETHVPGSLEELMRESIMRNER